MKHCFQTILCLLALVSICACAAPMKKKENLPQLVIGITIYEPYFYRDNLDEYAGIDAELAREACDRMGYEPVFVELDAEKRFDSLQNGEVDCLWTTLSMEGREDEYLWAGPYLYTQRVVVVRADSDIQSLADLAGKRMAVMAGTTSEKVVLQKMNGELPMLRQLTVFGSQGEVFTALRKGYVDAIAGQESSLRVYTDEYPEQYRYLNMSIRSEALGIAFKKDGDAGLTEQLTNILAEMTADGTTAAIVESYGLDVQKNVYGGNADAQTETR